MPDQMPIVSVVSVPVEDKAGNAWLMPVLIGMVGTLGVLAIIFGIKKYKDKQ